MLDNRAPVNLRRAARGPVTRTRGSWPPTSRARSRRPRPGRRPLSARLRCVIEHVAGAAGRQLASPQLACLHRRASSALLGCVLAWLLVMAFAAAVVLTASGGLAVRRSSRAHVV